MARAGPAWDKGAFEHTAGGRLQGAGGSRGEENAASPGVLRQGMCVLTLGDGIVQATVIRQLRVSRSIRDQVNPEGPETKCGSPAHGRSTSLGLTNETRPFGAKALGPPSLLALWPL